jgi:hypothetical protein
VRPAAPDDIERGRSIRVFVWLTHDIELRRAPYRKKEVTRDRIRNLKKYDFDKVLGTLSRTTDNGGVVSGFVGILRGRLPPHTPNRNYTEQQKAENRYK